MGQFFMHFSLQNIFEKIHMAPEWVLFSVIKKQQWKKAGENSSKIRNIEFSLACRKLLVWYMNIKDHREHITGLFTVFFTCLSYCEDCIFQLPLGHLQNICHSMLCTWYPKEFYMLCIASCLYNHLVFWILFISLLSTYICQFAPPCCNDFFSSIFNVSTHIHFLVLLQLSLAMSMVWL